MKRKLSYTPALLEAMAAAKWRRTCCFPGCNERRYRGGAPNPFHVCHQHRKAIQAIQSDQEQAYLRRLRENGLEEEAALIVTGLDAQRREVYRRVARLRHDRRKSSRWELMICGLMNADLAGRWLGCSAKLIRRLARSGELPHLKVGGEYWFISSAITEWMEQKCWENFRQGGKS